MLGYGAAMQPNRARRLLDALPGLPDADVLAVVTAGVQRLRDTTLGAQVDDDALRERVARLQRLESAVHAEKLRSVAEVDARKAFQAVAQRSTPDWLADACGLTANEARQQARTAEALSRLPNTAAKLAQGAITPGHAHAAVRGLAELERQAAARRQDAGADVDAWDDAVQAGKRVVDDFDAMVAGAAIAQDRVELGKTITGWTAQHQPDAAAQRERRAWRRRGHWWSDTPDDDGLYRYHGRATAAAKAQVNAVLEPLARKTSKDDDRSVAQRRHDALVDMAARAADSSQIPAVGGTRAQCLVIREQPPPPAPADASGHAGAGGGEGGLDGAAGPAGPPAYVDGIGPVPDATADLFGCDADTTIIRRDPHTQRIWDVGHADGDPSPAQRKAVVARDRRCVGCGAQAARCQIHHIRWRRDGGATSTANLVLVCWSCHNGIHHLGWTIQGDTTTGYTINRHPAGADNHARADNHAGAPPPHL